MPMAHMQLLPHPWWHFCGPVDLVTAEEEQSLPDVLPKNINGTRNKKQ